MADDILKDLGYCIAVFFFLNVFIFFNFAYILAFVNVLTF